MDREDGPYMKVCMITPTFFPRRGGAEVGIYELSRRLLELAHEVTVITPEFDHMKDRENIDGIEVYRFPSLLKFPASIPQNVIHFYVLLKRIKPDVVNMHYMLPTGIGAAIVCKTLHTPAVLSVIGQDIYDPIHPTRRIYYPLMKWIMSNVKRITCISSFVMQRAIELGAPPSRTEVVPFGVDVDMFNPQISGKCIREKYGLADEPIVLAVQRLSPRKAVEYLIQAVPHVLEKVPETTFLIVDGGQRLRRLKDLAEELKVKDRIVFVGSAPRSALPKYYAAADIFVLHSRFEALGLVLLEAMSSGKPVVTTRVGGTTDIVEPGKTGFLVEPKNPIELARAITTLLKNKQLRNKMGDEARKKVTKYFSWESVTHKMLKIYKETTSEARLLS